MLLVGRRRSRRLSHSNGLLRERQGPHGKTAREDDTRIAMRASKDGKDPLAVGMKVDVLETNVRDAQSNRRERLHTHGILSARHRVRSLVLARSGWVAEVGGSRGQAPGSHAFVCCGVSSR